MKKLLILFSLLFIAGSLYGAPQESGKYLHRDLDVYSTAVVFKNLPAILKEFKPYFQAIAFVILTGSLVFAFKNATEPKGYLNAIAMAGILSLVIANSSFFMQVAHNTVMSLNRATRLDSTNVITERIYNMASCFKHVKVSNLDADRVMENKVQAEGFDVKDEKKDNILEKVMGLFGNPVDSAARGIKTLFVMLVGFVVHSLLFLCSFLVLVLECVQYFLVQCGTMILPIFVAGLMTQIFRSQSIAYIFGLLGIICWPLGLSLGHIGTLAIVDGITSILNGSIITDSGTAQQVIADLSKVDNAYQHTLQTASWVAVASLGSLVSLVLMVLGLFIWVVVVTLAAPCLVQEVLSKGAQFFTKLASGTAQTMANTVGGAASYAMVRSAQATTLRNAQNGNYERAEPSTAMRAGFAAARTMMNASRYQGDTSQIPQVFDTGLDEMRHYRSEADIARAAATKKAEPEEKPWGARERALHRIREEQRKARGEKEWWDY